MSLQPGTIIGRYEIEALSFERDADAARRREAAAAY